MKQEVEKPDFESCKAIVAKKFGLGSTLVTGHKATYWEEAAEHYIAPLQARIKELEAENEELRKALDEIVNPLKYIQMRAEQEGMQVNGYMASELSRSASYLKEIAERALRQPLPSKPIMEDLDGMFNEWIGDKGSKESQDNLWTEVLKTMNFFPAPKYLIDVKEQFIITRKERATTSSKGTSEQ